MQSNIIIHSASCLCPPNECKSNIHPRWGSHFVLHQLQREISASLAAKCSTVFSLPLSRYCTAVFEGVFFLLLLKAAVCCTWKRWRERWEWTERTNAKQWAERCFNLYRTEGNCRVSDHFLRLRHYQSPPFIFIVIWSIVRIKTMNSSFKNRKKW